MCVNDVQIAFAIFGHLCSAGVRSGETKEFFKHRQAGREGGEEGKEREGLTYIPARRHHPSWTSDLGIEAT